MKSLICISIFLISLTLNAKLLNNDGEHYKNPYIVFSVFNAETIGMIAKDFFARSTDSDCSCTYFLINKKNLKVEKISGSQFYNMFPSASKISNLNFEEYFKIKDSIKLITGENIEVKDLRDPKHKAFSAGVILTKNSKQLNIVRQFPIASSEINYSILKVTDKYLWLNQYIFLDSDEEENTKVRSSQGLEILDLKEEKLISYTFSYNPFDKAWISSVEKDDSTGLFWIGTNYGAYALDGNFNEKISCFLELSKFKRIDKMTCIEADYTSDIKKEQTELLLKKIQALKAGKNKPEDITGTFKNKLEARRSKMIIIKENKKP